MFLKTIHQKKSALYTIGIMSIVLLLMFFLGLRYVDRPEEYGVAINFGTSDLGSGPPLENKSIESNTDVEDVVESELKEEASVVEENLVEEEVVTQDLEEAPVLKKPKEVKKEIQKKVEKKIVKKPSPNQATQSALSNLFGKKNKGKSAISEGDDALGKGVKGDLNGDANANKYYGNSGFGGLGNYALKGRKLKSKPIKKPTCNEEGVVVVKVEVDTSGKVIFAEPGVKGTTNHSPCLLKPAKEAALLTRWYGDGDAPAKQIGYIRYQFTLGE